MRYELLSKPLLESGAGDSETNPGSVDRGVSLRVTRTIGLLLLLAAWLGTQAARAQISGSAHDFSAQGWSGGEICIVCHAPHNSDISVANAPLWNHEVSVAVYEVYGSPTMDVVVGQPGNASKLCLSCHDGTVAVDSFGGNFGSNFVTGSRNLGTGLNDDHPVGMDWLHQTQPPDCTGCHDTHGNNPALLAYDALPFFGAFGSQTVECPTCHDAHNSAGFPSLLRKSMNGSELCLTCHNK